MEYPAGIGPSPSGLTVYGGQSKSGGSSIVQANPDGSFLRTFRADGRAGGEMQTASSASLMRTYHENGTSASAIQSSPGSSLMRTYHEDGTGASTIHSSPGSALMRTYHEDGTEASTIHSSPGLTLMRTYHTDGSGAGEVQVFGASCLMRATTPGGGRGYIRVDGTSASQAVKDDNGKFVASVHADDREAYLHSAAGGTRRYLSVDADGIWVKTNRGGTWKHYNLEETAQDSGWVNLSYASGFGS